MNTLPSQKYGLMAEVLGVPQQQLAGSAYGTASMPGEMKPVPHGTTYDLGRFLQTGKVPEDVPVLGGMQFDAVPFFGSGIGNYLTQTGAGNETSYGENAMAALDLAPGSGKAFALAGAAGTALAKNMSLKTAPASGLAQRFPKQQGRVGTEEPWTVAHGKGGNRPREEIEAEGLWHPIGADKKLKTPVHEMEHTYVDDPMAGTLADEKLVNPEDLMGATLIPAVGDRSHIGQTLTHVNGNELLNPVRLEGGRGFMRGDNVWASDQGVITSLYDMAQPALERGDDAILTYLPMGHGSLGFNTMMTDAAMGQLGDVPKKVAGAIDKRIRTGAKADPARPEWVGLKDSGAQAQLHDGPGALRHAFIDALDKVPGHGVDLAATRHAITDPALLDQPIGMGGQSLARLDGTITNNPAVPHSTYKTQMGGDYVGSLGLEGLPPEVLFPDFYKYKASMGKTNPAANWRALTTSKAHVPQHVDQEWIDRVMGYRETGAWKL